MHPGDPDSIRLVSIASSLLQGGMGASRSVAWPAALAVLVSGWSVIALTVATVVSEETQVQRF